MFFKNIFSGFFGDCFGIFSDFFSNIFRFLRFIYILGFLDFFWIFLDFCLKSLRLILNFTVVTTKNGLK